MKHMEHGLRNILLITSRMTKGESFQHITVTRGLAEAILLSSKTSNNAIVFPLYFYPDEKEEESVLALGQTRQPNFTRSFLQAISDNIGLPVIDGSGDFKANVGAEDVLHYIMSILHSPAFRSRYADPLTRDFPHLPLTGSLALFRALARLGGELVALHLLESPRLDQPLTVFLGPNKPEVERVGWSDGTVWLDAAATKKGQPATHGSIGFRGVPEEVWNFHIGGYQVCEKWLKDRKGRTLSDEDITHYQKIIVALAETIRLMKEIDEVIEQYGGWPGAFQPRTGTTA